MSHRGEPGATHLHTHSTLKFYTEEHHRGAKRFYGYTFGLHLGVLGGRKPPWKGLQPVPWKSCFTGSCYSSTTSQPRDRMPEPPLQLHPPTITYIYTSLRNQYLTLFPNLFATQPQMLLLHLTGGKLTCEEQSWLPITQLGFNEL